MHRLSAAVSVENTWNQRHPRKWCPNPNTIKLKSKPTNLLTLISFAQTMHWLWMKTTEITCHDKVCQWFLVIWMLTAWISTGVISYTGHATTPGSYCPGGVCRAWIVNLLKQDRQTRTGFGDWCGRIQRLLEHVLQQTMPHLRQWCCKTQRTGNSANTFISQPRVIRTNKIKTYYIRVGTQRTTYCCSKSNTNTVT